MIVSEIQLYELLKAKLGEKEAGAFVEILERRVDKKFEENKSILATKEDLARLEGRIDAKISETKAELIKWMFIFWIGQLASFIAIAKFFLQ